VLVFVCIHMTGGVALAETSEGPDRDFELQLDGYPTGFTLGFFVTDELSLRIGSNFKTTSERSEIGGVPVAASIGLQINLINLAIAYQRNLLRELLGPSDQLDWQVMVGYTWRHYSSASASFFGSDAELAFASVYPVGGGVTYTYWVVTDSFIDFGVYARVEGGLEYRKITQELNSGADATETETGLFTNISVGVLF